MRAWTMAVLWIVCCVAALWLMWLVGGAKV